MGNVVEQLFEKPSKRELLLLAISGAAVTLSVLKSLENFHLRDENIHDDKTGLYTEKYFRKEVVRRTSGGKRVGDVGRVHALLFCDLDWFDRLNLEIGHPGTDERALKPAAHAVLDAIRSESDDDLAGRFGGDEFVVFLSDVQNFDNALRIARKIRTGVNAINPYSDFGEQFQLGISIGCALLNHGTDFEHTLRQADIALYAAKAADPQQNQIIPFSDDLELKYGKYV